MKKHNLLTLSKNEAETAHRLLAEELPQVLPALVFAVRCLKSLDKQAPPKAIGQAEALLDSGIDLVCALQEYAEKNYPKAEWIKLYTVEVAK
jgi:hypothetical protein